MKRKFGTILLMMSFVFFCKAQSLDTFSTTLAINESGKSDYLSIPLKKSFTEKEAISNKASIDIVLIRKLDDKRQSLEWYTMNSKDDLIPTDLIGNNTMINAISFDREQFDKCKTNQDVNRMTGYITKNAFSHFASVTDNSEQGIKYPCFIIQLENEKRVLLWLDAIDKTHYKVMLKLQV